MTEREWLKNKVKRFTDQFQTTYIKLEQDHKYDYLFDDGNGIDYCTCEQLAIWDIEIIKDES